MIVMQPEENTDNRIFKNAFAGVLLFISAFGFAITNFSKLEMLEGSSVMVVATLAAAALALLYKAVKNDRDRVGQI
jgi:hypothetical protein